ncbi:uncharacterized protein [Diadema antillarum]|uniref:uncharacterized protein n=1 Tax=Diadema antillarum TaxID=105358 RepID=UPI003A86E0F8
MQGVRTELISSGGRELFFRSNQTSGKAATMNLLRGILERRLRLCHAVFFSFTMVNFILCCQACSCTSNPEVCDGSYIFEGMIAAQYGNASGFDDITYSVDVRNVTKDVDSDLTPGVMVNITTGTNTCGFPDLEVNSTVLFSTTRERDGPYSYSIDTCGSVVLTADDEEYHDLTCSATGLGTATPLLLLVCSTLAMLLHSQPSN